jgi:hypothetical protein
VKFEDYFTGMKENEKKINQANSSIKMQEVYGRKFPNRKTWELLNYLFKGEKSPKSPFKEGLVWSYL